MKKIILFITALFTAATIMADPNLPPTPIVLDPIHNGNGGHTRTPVAMPVFYLDGYTLTASSYTVGSTVKLLDENGDVVFSTYIYIEGAINLPTTLSGIYTIQVIRGSITFEGEIELN